MEFVEKTAKTVEMAVEAALKHLEADRDDVEVEIIDAPTKGLLGIGAKPAKVKVILKYNPEKLTHDFIKEIGVAMNLLIEVETKMSEKRLDVVISGENMGILIGKRGQTLDALQHLISLAINKGSAPFVNVYLDAENYRSKRKEALETLAKNLARKVKTTKKPVTLEPMSTFERRIIHAALQGDRGIITHSEGSDPKRSIVIAPKRAAN